MSMYGTRDAALNWATEYTSTLLASGYIQGRASPCLFHHPGKNVSIMVHGDDFIAVGEAKDIADTEKVLKDKYRIKVEHLGNEEDCVPEIKVLNKIIRCTEQGLELEADPRHVEIVINDLGLKDAKANSVPGAKPVKRRQEAKDFANRVVNVIDEKNDQDEVTDDEDVEYGEGQESESDVAAPDEMVYDDDDELDAEDARRYRAIAARLNYLAVDRVDLQYSVKEAARCMAKPLRAHWQKLIKIGRYLIGTPRLVVNFPWQEEVDMVTSYTDSDWAGCVRSAKSTSGGIIAIGDHIIKTYSRQQRVIALSSAEAELYAMVAASAEGLACIALAKDIGLSLTGEVYTDSSAALGISQRAGLGKVRHLRTQGLWVQECHVSKRLHYKKILGTKNPADVLTKYVPSELMNRHMETLGVERRGRRAEAAPELNSVEPEI